MNDLNKLIDTSDPAWPLVQQWLQSSRNDVELLSHDTEKDGNVLHGLQVTTRSPLGAIAFETGGILFDHGWLRFLGGGCGRMHLDLLAFTPAGHQGARPLPEALVVAHDAVGGFFALNGGMFPGEHGTVYYLGPDTLEWESLEMGYSELLNWAAHGDLAAFYEDLRWPEWEQEVQSLGCDKAAVHLPASLGGRRPYFHPIPACSSCHRVVEPRTRCPGSDSRATRWCCYGHKFFPGTRHRMSRERLQVLGRHSPNRRQCAADHYDSNLVSYQSKPAQSSYPPGPPAPCRLAAPSVRGA